MTSHLQGVGNGDLITLITTFLGASIKCSINLQWQFETMFVLYLEVYVAAKHNFVFQVESDKHFAEMSNASNREEAIVRWHEHTLNLGGGLSKKDISMETLSASESQKQTIPGKGFTQSCIFGAFLGVIHWLNPFLVKPILYLSLSCLL